MTKFLNISTDTTLGGNSPSDDIVSSQKALKTYIDNNSGASVAIDNSTITKNGSDQLQAVATVNANTAAGATNPIYDWVGTLAEYTSQAVATNHPDWICYITDDISGGGSVYTKAEVDNIFATLYPVGSLYIGTQSTCPLATIIPGSTWTIVSTNLVTSVNTSATVAGNGNVLGFTSGSNLAYMNAHNETLGDNRGWMKAYVNGTPTSVGDMKVTTNAANSGLTATVTRSNLTVNVWRRTA